MKGCARRLGEDVAKGRTRVPKDGSLQMTAALGDTTASLLMPCKGRLGRTEDGVHLLPASEAPRSYTSLFGGN